MEGNNNNSNKEGGGGGGGEGIRRRMWKDSSASMCEVGDNNSRTMRAHPPHGGEVEEEEEEEEEGDSDTGDDDEVDDDEEEEEQQQQSGDPASGPSRHNHNHNGKPPDSEYSTCRVIAAAIGKSGDGDVRMLPDAEAATNRAGGGGGWRESLRLVLSDPITGSLMHDAFILPCGHSFAASTILHILSTTKACSTCSNPISSQRSILPNLSLQVAVQAFLREEELPRSSKRRRDHRPPDQDKGGVNGDPNVTDWTRGRGVQFPFAVTDRVIIKGNKRTPPRFIGREAVVTTQCLNGWYVVKTLDNAESVKLQYRSLAKLSDEPSSKSSSSKMAPTWLQ